MALLVCRPWPGDERSQGLRHGAVHSLERPGASPPASSRRERASAPALQLLAQGGQGLLLGPLH